MCGLGGEIRFDGARPSAATLEGMVDSMAGRGPDGSGMVVRDRVGLAQRRLRIFDLSEHSQQPMVDSTLGLTLVFNGAIYNYRELRARLEGLGYRFFSDGDTEVVLKAYRAWGGDFVDHLNGMFAIAVYERDTGRLTLARDRLGIKPMYLARVAGGLRFASSLPALLAGGSDGIDTDIDPVALHHYLTFHAVVPPPHTILKGVRKLPPATVLRIEADGRECAREYWSLRLERGPDDARRPFAEWQERVLDALRQAVARRLVADVDVGVLLSGGLDSSLITGLIAEAHDGGLRTFSVGFEAVGEAEGDEFRYSDVVAERFGTDHRRIVVGTDEVLATLPDCIAAMAEPMVSHDAIGFYLLSREVAREVKAVQSGQGADEVFGGYHWYPPLLDSTDPVADYARVFFDRSHDEVQAAVHPRFVNGDASRRFVEERMARDGAATPADQALRLDTTVMLVDDPVKRVDNMTMAWGLEARVPFLDHELVELAARIPPEHKVAQGGKHVLKEAARRVIPAEVIDRPKGYFPVPALTYLRGPYLDLVRDALTSRAARERGLFRPDYVDTLLADPEGHLTPLGGSKLWQLGLLELWLGAHAL